MTAIKLRQLETMEKLHEILGYCAAEGVPRRSFVVALIVGSVLNLINQGDAIFGAADVNLIKIVLTFAVPYCVATYGAVSIRMSMRPRQTSVETLAEPQHGERHGDEEESA